MEKFNPIGIVVSIDFEGLTSWRLSEKFQQPEKIIKPFQGLANTHILEEPFKGYHETPESILEKVNSIIYQSVKELQDVTEYSIKYSNPILVYYSDKDWTVIGWGDIRRLLPSFCLKIKLYKTYENYTGQQIKALMSKTNLEAIQASSKIDTVQLTAENSSMKTLTSALEETEANLQSEEKKMKDELEKLRQDYLKKQEDLKKLMSAKMNELEEKKKEFKKQIFQLDHQLYLLRCFLGDAATIVQLREGTRAPKDLPVVMYQKLRFLDEDLGKFKAIYTDINLENEPFIERVFQKDTFLMEQFCPSPKCVTLFRISKDNTFYSEQDGNLLERCQYYNGTKIGILIRNGENLWLSWTDDSRIYLKENFMLSATPSGEVVSPDDDDVITDPDFTNNLNVAWKQFFSRQFLITILKGFVENLRILDFPESVDLSYQGKYVIFSTADNQITDTRFGTLSDYMKYANKLTRRWEYVLPIMHIQGSFTERDFWGDGSYENHERGRGDANRVRGCCIDDDVQQINLVELPEKITRLYQPSQDFSNLSEDDLKELKVIEKEYNEIAPKMEDLVRGGVDPVKVKLVEGNIEYTYPVLSAGKRYVWIENNQRLKADKKIIIKREIFPERTNEIRWYISVDKPEEYGSNRSGKIKVKSNIRIYPDEFINLSYLSSEILLYYIESKQIGEYFQGNYARSLTYLHKAIDFIRKRENDEYLKISQLIGRDVSKRPHIGTIIANWKFREKVFELKPLYLKRLAKYLVNLDTDSKYHEILENLPWVDKN